MDDERIISIQRCVPGCTRVVIQGDHGGLVYIHSELDKDAVWLPNLRADSDELPVADVVFPEFDRNNRGK